jgi:Flp pilus assembly protein TadD
MIALARKEYSRAIEELRQANLQDPQNLYRLALAYQGSGRKDDARSFCTQAAKFNVLPALNYAFIRKKAETLLMTI